MASTDPLRSRLRTPTNLAARAAHEIMHLAAEQLAAALAGDELPMDDVPEIWREQLAEVRRLVLERQG